MTLLRPPSGPRDDASRRAALPVGTRSAASRNPAIKVVGQPFTQEPYGIGLPLDDPSAKQFVNDWLQKIYADGSWTKLWQATVGQVVQGDPPTPPTLGSVPGS